MGNNRRKKFKIRDLKFVKQLSSAWKVTADFIKHPPLIPVLVLWVLSVAYFVLFFDFVLDMRSGAGAIVVYCFFPIVLFLAIYTALRCAPELVSIVLKYISKYKYGKRLATEYAFRINVFSSLSTAINVIYVIYNLIIAIVIKSTWYGTLSVAYALLVGMRLYCLDCARRQQKRNEVDYYKAYKCLTYIGAVLLVYSAVFSFAIYQMFSVDGVTHYPRFILYVVIGYTIYKAILSVFSYIKAKRYRNPVWRSIRHIAICDCIVSAVSLFYSMLYDMIAADYIHVFNVLSGIIGIVGAISIAWTAIFMIYHGIHGLHATRHLGQARIVHMDDLMGINYEAEIASDGYVTDLVSVDEDELGVMSDMFRNGDEDEN